MAHQYLLDPHTSAKRILAIVLGLVEVGLGVVQIKQSFEQRSLIVFLDGLNAIAYGVKSILGGWGAEGVAWLDLGKEARHIVCLFVRIKGLRHVLQTVLELVEHWGHV